MLQPQTGPETPGALCRNLHEPRAPCPPGPVPSQLVSGSPVSCFPQLHHHGFQVSAPMQRELEGPTPCPRRDLEVVLRPCLLFTACCTALPDP